MKTQGQIQAFQQYEGKLSKLFATWNPQALGETVTQAKATLDRHGGDFAKARESISELAYGNVSLRCSAHYRPIDNVLDAMSLGYTL